MEKQSDRTVNAGNSRRFSESHVRGTTLVGRCGPEVTSLTQDARSKELVRLRRMGRFIIALNAFSILLSLYAAGYLF